MLEQHPVGLEVAAGVLDRDMAQVGAERREKLLNITALCVPIRDSVDSEAVTEVMESRCSVGRDSRG